MELRGEQLLGKTFMYNDRLVDVTHLEEDESLAIVTDNYIGFYAVKISDLKLI